MGGAVFPSLLCDLRPNYCVGNKDNGNLLQKVLGTHCCTQGPQLQETTTNARLCRRLLTTHRQLWVSLLWDHCSFTLDPGVHKVFCKQQFVCPILFKFCNQIPLVSKVKIPGASHSLCQIPRLGNLLWVLEL